MIEELLPLSIGIGLVFGLLFAEFFGLAAGGMIVPGYMALRLNRPQDVLVTVCLGILVFLIVQALSGVVIVFGRRRTAIMILLGFLLGMMARRLPGFDGGVVGYIIPGLIALWIDRQGIFQTLGALIVISVLVRLVLILLVGTEGLA